MSYTEDEKNRGYRECLECDSGIELLQAGFDVETHVCALCKKDVADRDEFFSVGAEVLGKD
jgi:hypothetical protein